MTEFTLITGNTYPVKDALKALGGRWDATAKGWNIPNANLDEARALITAAPLSHTGSWTGRRGSRERRRTYGSSYTRFSSGAEVFTNVNGRCEDAPCCGCCS